MAQSKLKKITKFIYKIFNKDKYSSNILQHLHRMYQLDNYIKEE